MSSSTPELPANVHVSQHPCLRAKLSQLRSQSTPAKEVKTLVNDIALMVAYEALGASTKATDGSKVTNPSFQSCFVLQSTTRTDNPRSGFYPARIRLHINHNLPLQPLPRPHSAIRSRHGRR